MADPIRIPLGKDALLFYATAGNTPDGSISISGVSDLTLVISKDEAETSRRASLGYEDSREGLKRLQITFTLTGTTLDTVGTEDTEFAALIAAYFGSQYVTTPIAFHAVSDIASNGGYGPMGDFILTGFDRNETLGDAQSYSVSARMTQVQGRIPTWIASPV